MTFWMSALSGFAASTSMIGPCPNVLAKPTATPRSKASEGFAGCGSSQPAAHASHSIFHFTQPCSLRSQIQGVLATVSAIGFLNYTRFSTSRNRARCVHRYKACLLRLQPAVSSITLAPITTSPSHVVIEGEKDVRRRKENEYSAQRDRKDDQHGLFYVLAHRPGSFAATGAARRAVT